MSMPAALGDAQGDLGIARVKRDFAIALRHRLLHHSGSIVALRWVPRLAHSLKRDTGPAAANRQTNSPMLMTSPMTTLPRGQYAPLLHRSSAAPHSTLPQCSRHVFLRRDLLHKADCYANIIMPARCAQQPPWPSLQPQHRPGCVIRTPHRLDRTACGSDLPSICRRANSA